MAEAAVLLLRRKLAELRKLLGRSDYQIPIDEPLSLDRVLLALGLQLYNPDMRQLLSMMQDALIRKVLSTPINMLRGLQVEDEILEEWAEDPVKHALLIEGLDTLMEQWNKGPDKFRQRLMAQAISGRAMDVESMPNTTDWEDLALTSHYATAVAIKAALEAGKTQDAMQGLEELIDALSRSDERAIKSYLVRLMQHVMKWQVQPHRRSPSWVATIREARDQVRDLQEEHPRFTDERIQTWWPRLLRSARNEAESEMNQAIEHPPALTWEEVFETEYRLPEQ